MARARRGESKYGAQVVAGLIDAPEVLAEEQRRRRDAVWAQRVQTVGATEAANLERAERSNAGPGAPRH